MMLEIYELGARKKSARFVVDDTTAVYPDLIAFEIYLRASRMRALASRNIGATWNPETATGTIMAGFRIVGKVRKLS